MLSLELASGSVADLAAGSSVRLPRVELRGCCGIGSWKPTAESTEITGSKWIDRTDFGIIRGRAAIKDATAEKFTRASSLGLVHKKISGKRHRSWNVILLHFHDLAGLDLRHKTPSSEFSSAAQNSGSQAKWRAVNQ